MYQKDYIKFAEMFKQSRDELIQDATLMSAATLQATDRIIKQTADLFANDNPRFDRDRFLRACGIV